MFGAAAALGIDYQRKSDQAIAVELHLTTPSGLKSAWTLIDCGAESNFVNQKWVDQHLPNSLRKPRKVQALDGHRIKAYGQHKIPVHAQDANGLNRTHTHVFEAVDITGYDLILGFPWLQATNPIIDWEARTWIYRDTPLDGKVEFISAHKAAKTLLKGNSAFLLIPTGEGYGNNATVFGAAVEQPTLPKELEDFADVFSEEEATSLPEHTSYDHAIDMLPGKEPPYKPIYALTVKEQEVLREYIESSLSRGLIRESKSPAGAPIFFIPKKDGTLRLCVDYRGLNAITIKNRYPLPLIMENLDRLAGAKIFTQLDLRWAYHRIRIREGDEWKTAFRTRLGHYEYCVMPFGLANAPSTFQSYINRALSNLIDVCCVVYLDDIVIFSRTPEEHVRNVRAVLEKLRQYRLYANMNKCAFDVDTIAYLGFIITPRGVEMEPDRVKTIQEWPEPTCVKDVMSFLGFANFYRKFIEGYSRIAAPLINLTKGSQHRKGSRHYVQKNKFTLTKDAKDAFQKLKNAFCSAPMLRHYDPNLPTRLETDASGAAVSGIVSQKQLDDGQWHPIAYYSRKLTEVEARYETHDSELLAIVASFKHWRHYLEGSKYPITVLSDHANLRYFMTTKELNRRQARWAEQLSAFDFNIEHRPGAGNPADAPSRRPDYMEDIHISSILPTLQEKLQRGIFQACNTENETLNKKTLAELAAHPRELQGVLIVDENQTCGLQNAPADESCTAGVTRGLELLVPRSIVVAAMRTETAYTEMPVEMEELVWLCQRGDAFAKRHINDLQDPSKSKAEHSPWHVDDKGLLRYNNAAYIPPDQALQLEIMRINHDDPQGGHFGVKRTQDCIRAKYYWNGMLPDIEYYVRTCDACQHNKIHRHKPYGLLQPLPIPKAPFETVTMDFITGLPVSDWEGRKYDSILAMVCPLTKYAIYVPCKKDIDAEGLGRLLLQNLIKFFTMPKHIVSDRGSLFTSEFWGALCHYLRVKRKLSTAYHPQTDGQTERQNQILEHYLRTYCNFEQNDWAQWLPLAQHVYNNSVHSVTGKTPMELLMGFRGDLRINLEEEPQFPNEKAHDRIERLGKMRHMLQIRLQNAKEEQAKYYNRHRKEMTFKIGDFVMIRSDNITSPRECKKLDERQIGPFPIIDAWGKNAYKLRLVPKYRDIHPVFHVSLLEPYYVRAGRPLPPAHVEIEGEKEYVIDEIISDRIYRRRKEYLVRWKDYTPPNDTSWEPEDYVNDTQALDIYLDKQKEKTQKAKRGRSTKRKKTD